MGRYTSVDGTQYTDEDIEQWAAETESERGYTGGHVGPPVAGRPVSVDSQTE